MKKYSSILFASLALMVSFSLPVNYALAQTSTTQNEVLLQIINSLLKQIELLQQKLNEKKAQEGIQVTINKEDYQNEIEPLLDQLDELEDEKEVLLQKIKKKECADPRYVRGKNNIVKFFCNNPEIKRAASSSLPDNILNDGYTQYPSGVDLEKIYGISRKDIRVVNSKITIVPYSELVELNKELSDLQEEIDEIKDEIEIVKTKHGIS